MNIKYKIQLKSTWIYSSQDALINHAKTKISLFIKQLLIYKHNKNLFIIRQCVYLRYSKRAVVKKIFCRSIKYGLITFLLDKTKRKLEIMSFLYDYKIVLLLMQIFTKNVKIPSCTCVSFNEIKMESCNWFDKSGELLTRDVQSISSKQYKMASPLFQNILAAARNQTTVSEL